MFSIRRPRPKGLKARTHVDQFANSGLQDAAHANKIEPVLGDDVAAGIFSALLAHFPFAARSLLAAVTRIVELPVVKRLRPEDPEETSTRLKRQCAGVDVDEVDLMMERVCAVWVTGLLASATSEGPESLDAM